MRVQRVELGQRLIPYRTGWDLQRRVHAAVAAGSEPDTVLLLEHQDVFTAGSRTQPQDRPVDGSEVIDVDRGGRITWHGRGQLVGYPILRLSHPYDVVAHVRRIESLLIDVCAGFGVTGERIPGRSGVWLMTTPVPAKIAAIGVRVAQGVTMHGFALNCDCDLGWAQRIVPCGLSDAAVTSLSEQTGHRVSVLDAADALSQPLKEWV